MKGTVATDDHEHVDFKLLQAADHSLDLIGVKHIARWAEFAGALSETSEDCSPSSLVNVCMEDLIVAVQ